MPVQQWMSFMCVPHRHCLLLGSSWERLFRYLEIRHTLSVDSLTDTFHNRHNFGQVIKHGLPSWNCTAVCKEHFCFSWRKLWRPIKGAWIFSPSVSTPAGFELRTSDPVGENHSTWPPATCRLCLPERKAFASFIQTLPASKVSQAQSFTSYPVWLPGLAPQSLTQTQIQRWCPFFICKEKHWMMYYVTEIVVTWVLIPAEGLLKCSGFRLYVYCTDTPLEQCMSFTRLPQRQASPALPPPAESQTSAEMKRDQTLITIPAHLS